MTQVLKRDGMPEDWNRAKALISVVSAGASEQEAEKIVGEIETWVTAEAAKGPVPSAMIRGKIMQSLQTVNPTAAATYGGWKKPA